MEAAAQGSIWIRGLRLSKEVGYYTIDPQKIVCWGVTWSDLLFRVRPLEYRMNDKKRRRLR